MARSYNRIELIGNLTHDPELRKTPKGTSVCSFRLATDRTWRDEHGERQEESAFHRIVAWKTLAEQCAKYLRKGRKVFVAGRLAYRTYKNKVDGTEYPLAEIVIEDMLLLDDKRPAASDAVPAEPLEPLSAEDLPEDF
ncbi:MAG: single-stranded DNA-binding protein [Ktedonobacterales bacterium]